MQEQIIFKLSDGFINSTPGDLEVFKEELFKNIKAVEQLLVSYHFKSRGRVFNVSVEQNSIEFLNPVMVKLNVAYNIGQFNACADVDFTDRASMELLVDLDIENRKAIITGEYIPEREPDEF